MAGKQVPAPLLLSVLLLGLELPALAGSGGWDGRAADVLAPEAADRNPEKVLLALSRSGRVGFTRAADRPGAPIISVSLQGAADADLQWLAAFPHLEILEIKSARVTDRGVKHIGKLRGLRGAHLICPRLTEKGLLELKKALPRTGIDLGEYVMTGYREPAALAP